MNHKPHGIMFHHFHDDIKHPRGQGSISAEEFRKIIIWLQKNFNLISAWEWFGRSNNKNLLNDDICITFDDNLLCQYDIALPVLEEFNIKAFWFVYSSPLTGVKEKLEIYRYFRFDRFRNINDFYKQFNKAIRQSEENQEVNEKLKLLDLSKYLAECPFYSVEDKIFRFIRDEILGRDRYYRIMDEMIRQSDMDTDKISSKLWNTPSNIKNLHDKGHVIGLHSHTHPTEIKMMPVKEQYSEYKKNKEILESIIDSEIMAMSHPGNSYNKDTLNILNELNIHFGFRADMELECYSSLEHPRMDHALLMREMYRSE